MKNILIIILANLCFSCFSQDEHKLRVIPQLMISTKEGSHIGVIVKTINNSDNRYIGIGGYTFNRYLKIMKLDSANNWHEIEHPSITEIETRSKIDGATKSMTTYRFDYNTNTPLFFKWVTADVNFKQGELQNLDLNLNNEIAASEVINKVKKCLPSAFSLFFIEKQSSYEDFWNMDFLLQDAGEYKIVFVPDAMPEPCKLNFKGFDLISNSQVVFDSIQITVR